MSVKKTASLFGIIVLAAVIGLSMAACKEPGDGSAQTPVASDFEIGNLVQNEGSVTAVIITPKQGKSIGAITIYYNESTALPIAAGTYTVTFNVAAASGWNAASGLAGGTLTINSGTPADPAKQTPVASDYETGNLVQNEGSVTAVTITPKQGKSTGAITIYYNESTTLPIAAGTYTVTFNVAAASGWNAASGLAGGTLTINSVTPQTAVITLDVKQIIDGAPIITGITISRTGNGYPVTYNVSVNASDYDAITWEIAGVGSYANQNITGNASSFTLNAADVRYNSLGGHALILTVTKDGQQYQRAIPFTIVQ